MLMVGDLVSGGTFWLWETKFFSKLSSLFQIEILKVGDLISGGTL